MYFQSSSDFESMNCYFRLISHCMINWEWMLGHNRPWKFNCMAAVQHSFILLLFLTCPLWLSLFPPNPPISRFHFQFGGNPLYIINTFWFILVTIVESRSSFWFMNIWREKHHLQWHKFIWPFISILGLHFEKYLKKSLYFK